MRVYMRNVCVLTVIFSCGLFIIGDTVSAVVVDGRNSTDILWYSDMVDNSKQLDVSDSLRVSISEIDSGKKLSIKAYGKLDYETKGDKELQGRLYYGYADYKGFMDTADIRLGRQFVNLSAGSALVDGVEADINKIGPVGIVVMGGRDVVFAERNELTSHQYSVGAALYLAGLKKTDVDISYYRAYDHSDVIRDVVGGSFKQYLFNSIKLYGNARYDLTAEAFNEILAGITYFPTLNLMLTAEHFESYPTFDTTSIYSVFAVDQFKENVIRAEYTAASWFDVSMGFSREDFGEGGGAKLYEAGFKIRPSVNTTIGLFHDRRAGYPGSLKGYKIYGEYSAMGKWKASAGIDYDAYTRDDMTGQETARKYWAAGKYRFTKSMSGSLRVENSVNVNYSKDMQGRMTFDVDF